MHLLLYTLTAVVTGASFIMAMWPSVGWPCLLLAPLPASIAVATLALLIRR